MTTSGSGDDTPIHVEVAYKHFPEAPSGRTLRRYRDEGRRSFVNNQVHYLKLQQIGGSFYVTPRSWREFLERLNAPE